MVLQTGEKQRNSNLNLACKRQNSVHGKSRSDEKLFQNQLILDWSAIGWLTSVWLPVSKIWIIQDSSSTSIRWISNPLDSKLAKGIMKIIPAEFRRKINFLVETQFKNKRPMRAGSRIMFQMFSFLNIKKTQGPTMNLSELLNVEL